MDPWNKNIFVTVKVFARSVVRLIVSAMTAIPMYLPRPEHLTACSWMGGNPYYGAGRLAIAYQPIDILHSDDGSAFHG